MATRAAGSPVEILLVDDNPGDVDLTREGLAESKILNHLHVVGNGVEALAFLRRHGQYADAPRPDLILLDLNLPVKDGCETLREIKTDEDLKRIPVVVLTTSKDEHDVLKSYNLHANCYVAKPLKLDQYHHIVQSLQYFWSTIVTLPTRKGPP